MAIIVHKYGGTSMGSVERIKNVARRVAKWHKAGYQMVVVVSAMSGETNRLIGLAKEIMPNPDPRELDVIASTGEQVSIGLLAMALKSIGVDAVSFNGSQVAVHTDSAFTKARIESIDCEPVKRELDAGKVVIVAGFQGRDADGNVTTLGRGGSDTSAAALAAFLGAERCIIYTDVDGVYTTDPRVCPTARRLAAVSCDQMLRLAANGAQVLHDRSVALAARHGVTVEVRSCEAGSVGTLVVPQVEESREVTGVTRSRRGEVTRVTAIGRALPSLAAIRAAVSALETAGVTALGLEEGEQRVTLLVKRDDEDAALCAVHDALVPR